MESSGNSALITNDVPQLLTLLQVLSNPLILHHTIQYLPITSLLALGAASKPLQGIIHRTPNIFRYLDLSGIKSVQFEISQIDHGGEIWRNVQLDENVTEDDFYGGPLRGLFRELGRRHILENVQTLVLDGLSVTSELLTELILDDPFNVRLLSVREVRNLNERKLMQALEYSVRPTRQVSKPRLQGLYIFGKMEINELSNSALHVVNNKLLPPAPLGGVMTAQGAQLGAQINQRSRDALSGSLKGGGGDLYGKLGGLFPKQPMTGWARTMEICRGLISFDGILCTGPRHSMLSGGEQDFGQRPWYMRPVAYLPPAVATIALQDCNSCHSAPEGITQYGVTPAQDLPLLGPPPFHSSTIKAATRSNKTIGGRKAHLLHRCKDCLRGRYCEGCHKWWCEDCYELVVGNEGMKPPHAVISGFPDLGQIDGPGPSNFKVGAWRDCYECGFNCADCIRRTQHRCKVCGGGYCMIHNEGSTITTAGCARSGRRTRELY